MTAGDAFGPAPRRVLPAHEPSWGPAHVRAVGEVGINRSLRLRAIGDESSSDLRAPADIHGHADTLAERLRAELTRRGSHPETIRYCDESLVDRSLFYAMFAACQGLSSRIRRITGLKSDGLILINDAFSTKTANPPLRLNALMTETEIGDHRGLEGLIRGLFNTFRGNNADLPRVIRSISEQDMLDFLATLSYIHRRLDAAHRS